MAMRFMVNGFNVIAHNNNKIIGKLNVSLIDYDTFYINNLYINNDFRGNNYGHELINYHNFHFNHYNINTYKLLALNLNKDYKLYDYYKKIGFKIDYDYVVNKDKMSYEYDEIIPMKKKINL